MKKNKSYLIMTILSVAFLGILISSCGSKKANTEPRTQIEKEASIDSTGEESSERTEASEEESEKEIEYAADGVVNEFIKKYNAISSSSFENIDKGNIDIKYFAISYDYWFEMLHANDTDKIRVTITGTEKTAAGVAGMKEAFYATAKAIEPSLVDDEIYTYFDQLVSNEYMVDGDIFHSMEVKYIPDKKKDNKVFGGYICISEQ